MYNQPTQFHFGVASSAFQTEGAIAAHGKGPSIWDRFAVRRKLITNQQLGVNACEFYDRYIDDLELLKSMGIPNFRCSISWSRIFPDGVGSVNMAGVDHYKRLFDACLERGIDPWLTLYHWDLPQALEDRGGWTNREIVDWFSEFVYCCVKEFGDTVSNWMVLNEPAVFTGAGYFLGAHAPGKRGMRNYLPAVHHAALCQAAGIRIIKEFSSRSYVGTTFSCSRIQPYTDSESDRLAAHRVDALLNRLFLEPLIGRGYPLEAIPALSRIEKYFKPGDHQRLIAPFDFIGIQNYTREYVAHAWWVPFIHARLVPADKRKVFRTAMNWEVYPQGIHDMIAKFASYPEIRNIIVTENGAAFEDVVKDGEVHDPARTNYIREHLTQVFRAIKEGYSVSGYFVWSFTDNFEWAEGYSKRFGIVHVDYATQRRTIKSSGKWYADFVGRYNESQDLQALNQLAVQEVTF